MDNECNNEYHDNEYEEWLSFAKMDFESAKYLLSAPFYPRPLNVVCYHCQQAAEKAVKALIIYFGSQGGMPKLHDIAFLLNQVKNIVEEKSGLKLDSDLVEIADTLTKYGITSRYPNDEMDIDERKTKQAIVGSEKILIWVENVIEQVEKA